MPQDENGLASELRDISKRLEQIETRLTRMERNQDTMIGTHSEFSKAYREQQGQIRDHENRIEKLERGDQNYYIDFPLH